LEYFSPANPRLEGQGKQLADYIWNGLSRDVTRELMGQHLRRHQELTARIEKWEKSLDEWENKVAAHTATLKDIHQRYNFVALSKSVLADV
jgi:hypothetical protein